MKLTKINSKWIIDLNVRAKTMKHLEENIGDDLWDVGLSSNFSERTQKAQTIEEKKSINWTLIKMKNFLSLKDNGKANHELGESVCKIYICHNTHP